MTTTTDERRALGDWAAEMMGLSFDDWRRESLVSWAGMGLLVAAMRERGYTVIIKAFDRGLVNVRMHPNRDVTIRDDGDVPLAAFQAAREAIGVPNPESAPTLE